MKCGEGPSNMMSNIIRSNINHMKFAAYKSFPFITSFMLFWFHFFCHFIYGCTFRFLLFNFVNYLFLLLGLCIIIIIIINRFMYSYC